MTRVVFVECSSGRIWDYSLDLSHASPFTIALEGARRLDERLARFGRRYIPHPRNPAPGEREGYYVYRDDSQRDGELTEDPLGWQLLGFVEIVPSALVDRVWLERQSSGYVVHTTAGNAPLSTDPLPRDEAESLAREWALRFGAFFDSGACPAETLVDGTPVADAPATIPR